MTDLPDGSGDGSTGAAGTNGPLVQPEGVNAGSAAEVDEDAAPAPPEATREGGEPETYDPDHNDPDAVPRTRDLVGTPEPQEESGQDAGSL
jgi:hypothetical protein